MAYEIWIKDGVLAFSRGDRLATLDEYTLADRCVGSIFEALDPGDIIQLEEGEFWLEDDLDPVPVPPVIEIEFDNPPEKVSELKKACTAKLSERDRLIAELGLTPEQIKIIKGEN